MSAAPPRPRFEPPRFLAVEGPIRVGKSSLARILALRLGARLLLEPDDNPHLDGFYAGQPGAGFRAQMHFLLQRYCQLAPLGPERPSGLVVADYVFEKDRIFANINLSDAELQVYNQYYDLFAPRIAVPDLVIYLQASPEILRRRLERKNLPAEQRVSDAYLREVVKAYDHFFYHYTRSDVLVVNTTEIDFVEHSTDLQELMQRLEAPVSGTQYYLPLAGE